MLDRYYISVFNYYKKKLGKRSLKIALFYINLLELAILLVLVAFLLAFTSQMRFLTLSSTKLWTVYGLIALFVIFKNWMRYSGKKRNVLNAQLKGNVASIYILWLLPFGCLIIAFALLQVK